MTRWIMLALALVCCAACSSSGTAVVDDLGQDIASGPDSTNPDPDATDAQSDPGWQPGASLPEKRTEVSVVASGGLIYLLGGFGQDDNGSLIAPRTLWVYDPALDNWSDAGQIPAGVNHAGLVALDGKLYLVGGFSETGFQPVAEVWRYTISTGKWNSEPPLPVARGALAVCVVDGRLHALGGTVAGDNSTKLHHAWSPGDQSWVERKALPTARNHMGCGVIEGRIYLPAGRDAGDFELTTLEVYSPTSDSWDSKAPISTGRSGIAVVVLQEQLYVFGGESFNGPARTFADVERYDPLLDRWESLLPLQTGRHGLGAAVVDSTIYVISGGPGAGFTYSSLLEWWTPTHH